MSQTATAVYTPFAQGDPFVLHGLAEDETVFQPIRRDHVWEPHLLAVLERIVKPDAVCFDVGANIGAITLPLARLASAGRVHAFEASSAAAAILRQNIEANGLGNVTVCQMAIAEQTGATTELYTVPGQLGTAHRSIDLGREGDIERVLTLALDDYPSARLDLIKLDIEGGEIAALSGARRLIGRCHPALVVEYNPAPAEWFAQSARDALYGVLTGLYPRLELIEADGALTPIADWGQLDAAVSVRGWCDLLCTNP